MRLAPRPGTSRLAAPLLAGVRALRLLVLGTALLAGARRLEAAPPRLAPAGPQNGTWVAVGDGPLTPAGVVCCQMAFDRSGTPWIAYQDKRFSHAPTSVMRLEDGAWRAVGALGGASLDRGWYNHLAFDSAGRAYVACRDYGADGRANVRRYDPAVGAWQNVGPHGLTPDHAHYTHLVIDSDDVPWLAFQDRATTPPDGASVMRFVNGAWEYVGRPGLSVGGVGYPSLAVAPDGAVHVAFADGGLGGRASVLRWRAGSGAWEPVGLPGFSQPSALWTRLAIDAAGRPHVAYGQWQSRIVVERFDGTGWAQLGGSASGLDRPALETEPWRQWLSLAFDPAGRPLVAYQSLDEGLGAAVRRFDGATWTLAGGGGPARRADYMAMAVDRAGAPWLAFRDGGGNDGPLSAWRLQLAPAHYCSATASSTGVPAVLGWRGEPSLGTGALVLVATHLPPNVNGVFAFSPDPVEVPFGDGVLCVGSQTLGFVPRAGGGFVGPDGTATWTVDPASAPGLVPGSTWYFTYAYRDPANGGAGVNFAGGLQVVFAP